MLRVLTALVLATPAICLAAEQEDAQKDKQKGWENIFTLLPPGSELKDVMLPRYDAGHKLSSVLKAQVMRLVNDKQISGTTVAVEFFDPNSVNPDKSSQGKINLTTALIDKDKNLLSTKDPVKIKTDQGSAKGSGIYYDFKSGKGVLLGPATTIIPPQEKKKTTSMNTQDSPFRAMALVGMSLFSQSLLAAPPVPLTEAQLAAIKGDTATRAPAAEAKAEEAQAQLKADLEKGAAATQAATTFLVQNDLPVPKPDGAAPVEGPLEIQPGPDDTVVSCDGAIYFDPDERVLVYLKNVKVKSPEFDMKGRIDELKVFFGEKQPDEKKPDEKASEVKAPDANVPDEQDKKKPAKPDKKKDKSGFGAGFGSKVGKAERVVATGAIVIEAKPKPKEGKEPKTDEEPILASGAIFTYNILTDEGIISGGWPWVRQGPMYLKSKKADNLLRIYPKENRMDTPGGGWEMAAPMDKLNQDDKNKEKNKDKPNH